MKINKIYISAFGGLKDFTLELDDGLNVIFSENENGKSTVMAFIKAMFYGTGKKQQNLVQSTRLRYTPWDGSAMGGRIYFENKNRRYCLEREFRKSDANDKITLTDLDLGTTTDAPSDIGTQFFGIGADAFQASVFVGIFGLHGTDEDAASELNSRLSSLVLTGDEDTSFKTITDRIEKARNRILSKTGKAGSCAKDIQELSLLDSRLQNAILGAQRKQEINEELSQLENKYAHAIKLLQTAKTAQEQQKLAKNAHKLKEYLQLKSDLDQLTATLKREDGTVIDDMFIKKVNFCLNKLETHQNKINEINDEIERINTAIELSITKNPEEAHAEIAQARSKIDEITKTISTLTEENNENERLLLHLSQQKQAALNAKKPFNPIIVGLGGFITLIGIIVALLGQFAVGVPLAAVGVILLVLAFIIKPANKAPAARLESEYVALLSKSADIKNQRADLSEQLHTLNASVSALTAAINTDSAVKAQREADLLQKKNLLKAETEKYGFAKADLERLYSPHGNCDDIDNVRVGLSALEQASDSLKNIKLRLGYLSTDLGGISYEDAALKLKELQEANSNMRLIDTSKEATVDIESINLMITDFKSQITALETELKTAFRGWENPQDLKREITQLMENIAAQKQFCNAADIAIEILGESFIEVRRSYGWALEEKTLNIFSRLTNGRYQNLTVTKSLDITVEQRGIFGTRELGYLSSGTVDQAYLSLRLALASLMSEDENLPIFLDDSLSQYDDIRTNEAVKFLKEYSADSQILLFTCHSSVCDVAKLHNIEFKKLLKQV